MKIHSEKILPEGAHVKLEFLGEEGREAILAFRGTAVFDQEKNAVALTTFDLEHLVVWLGGQLLERRRELRK